MADTTWQVRGLIIASTLASGILLVSILRVLISPSGPADPRNERKRTPRSSLSTLLAERLPSRIFFQGDTEFVQCTSSYWTKQQRDIIPDCVVKPRTEEEVAIAIEVLKREFDQCVRNCQIVPLIAVRSGGHSTIPGASNVAGGTVIDLSLLNSIEIADDRSSVTVGCGARWGAVSRKLDEVKLAVVGGRNSDVGVGGLILGGGFSYFSPCYGFVCDNILQFRVVLSSGKMITASEHENSHLWRALKGGGSNFGIVTSFRLHAFPCETVWGGFLFMFPSKAPQIIQTLHEFTKSNLDPNASGPLVCISYVQTLGLKVISTQLTYTKAEIWPACWQSFQRIGRIWSTTKIRTLTSVMEELDRFSPAGLRQLHLSTTVKNDLATMQNCYHTFESKISLLRKVKGMAYTLVLQPLHTLAMMHGKDNVLGLHDRSEILILVLLLTVWDRESDDPIVNNVVRGALDEIRKDATSRGTADQFLSLNWSDDKQRPFESYRLDKLQFLQETSKSVDPDGFFQRSCSGGHKLP